MNLLFLLLVLLVAAVLQGWPLPWSWGGAPHMPWLVLVASYFMLARSLTVGLAAVIGAGLLQDALSGLPLGASVVVWALVGFVLRGLRGAFFVHRWRSDLALGWLAVLLSESGVYLVARMVGVLPPLGLFAFLHVLTTSLLGALMAPLLWRLLGLGERMLGLREAMES